MTYPTVYACVTRIASDIGKLPFITQVVKDGVWLPKPVPRFLNLLRRPNSYQTGIEFRENWLQSKLMTGNAYILIVRDKLGAPIELRVLDPAHVTPLVSEMGEVFYRITKDNLSYTTAEQETVPSTMVIHDRMNALYHPLVGLSPLYASSISARQGLAINKDSRSFFERGAKPSGVLTAPGHIGDDTVQRIKEYWQDNFNGDRSGNVAVLGDGLTYSQMRMTSVDAQLIDQLRMSSEAICSTFHVPAHMVGVGPLPTHDNIEALTQAYYSNCLQIHIEKMEGLLDYHLGSPETVRIELDLQRLFRTDMLRQIDILTKGVNGVVMKPNEARARLGLPPVDGGDTVYSQQQNYSLAALNKRDEQDDPFGTATPPAPEEPPEDDAEEPEENGDENEAVDAEELARNLSVITKAVSATQLLGISI